VTPQTPTEPFAAGGDRSSVIGETAADGRAPGLATTGARQPFLTTRHIATPPGVAEAQQSRPKNVPDDHLEETI
jgi:hypothetical protein